MLSYVFETTGVCRGSNISIQFFMRIHGVLNDLLNDPLINKLDNLLLINKLVYFCSISSAAIANSSNNT